MTLYNFTIKSPSDWSGCNWIRINITIKIDVCLVKQKVRTIKVQFLKRYFNKKYLILKFKNQNQITNRYPLEYSAMIKLQNQVSSSIGVRL